MSTASARTTIRPRLYYFLLLLVAAGLSLIALVLPELIPLSVSTIRGGQVASQDILAPQDITYESQVLTEQQRDAASRAVPSIFTSPDTNVARQKLEELRAALSYMATVRADPYASAEQKFTDMAALEGIHLSQGAAETILAVSDSRWQAVQQEAIAVLEQVMRSIIREDRLEEARRNIPTLVSLTLPESQAALVTELVAAFVTPNSFYSESHTEAAREKARQSIQPVSRTYQAGETVVQRGQIISSATLEALQKLGLVQTLLASGRTLLADGATGTNLFAMGLTSGDAPEMWNFEHPEKVRDLHRRFIEAGADIVLTNSFGGNRHRLALHGLESRVAELNRAATRLLRQVVDAGGERALVAGDIGPTGQVLLPYGELSFEDAREAFAEQTAGLIEGGVDLIWIETMSDLEEVRAAVEGARQVSADIPLVTTMTFDTHGRTMMGITPEKAVTALTTFGAQAVGGNCGNGPGEILGVIEKMHAALPGALLAAVRGRGHFLWGQKPVVGGGRARPQVRGTSAALFALGPGMFNSVRIARARR